VGIDFRDREHRHRSNLVWNESVSSLESQSIQWVTGCKRKD
jgi:hypothetical protein